MSYSIVNNEIFSSTGDLVAKIITGGEIIFAPGKKSQHAKKLKAWMNGEDVSQEEIPQITETPEKEVADSEDWRSKVGDWKLDKTLGVCTPEYQEFIKKYNLSIEEQQELIDLKLKG